MKKIEYYGDIKIDDVDITQKSKRKERQDFSNQGKFKDVNFKKSLGQNFLSDKNLLNKIADYAEVNENDNVLEIGAGAGTLTDVLATRAKKVVSYEIDKTLKERLLAIETAHDNLNVVFEDFMNVDLNTVFPNENFKVVANIPYYITTPIVFKLMEISSKISTMIFMVQKEVAERFASKENCKDYGITSVVLQSVADVTLKKVVKKECFTPAPKVDSALIEIKINKDKYGIKNYKNFCDFVHKSFSMRRKTLVNNLLKNYSINKENIIKNLEKLNYAENVRPEQINVKNYVKLFNLLFNI